MAATPVAEKTAPVGGILVGLVMSSGSSDEERVSLYKISHTVKCKSVRLASYFKREVD